MSQKKSKAIKRAVKALFESGEEPKNEAGNKVLVAALQAQPKVHYKPDADQTNVPKGKVRVKPVVLQDANPLRAAQRTANKKLTRTEQKALLTA